MLLLNLGSNIPPRHLHLDKAIEALRTLIPGTFVISEIYESEPWGYDSSRQFLNVGVLIHPDNPDLTPLGVLRLTEQAQATVDPSPHRDSAGNYIDRKIDIDIIAIDSLILSTPRLTLPHPRMHLRPFELTPLASLAPLWRHPQLGLTAAEMLDRLTSTSQ